MSVKVLANEDTLLPTQMYPRLSARNICCGQKFWVRDTKMFLILFRNILCPQQMFSCLRSPRNIMSNNVSATMCPRLPVPLWCKQNANWTTLSYSSNCSIFKAKKLETTSITVDKIYYLRSLFAFFTNFSFQIYFSTAENRQKNRILWQLAKIRLEWISQSDGSIGRPLGLWLTGWTPQPRYIGSLRV